MSVKERLEEPRTLYGFPTLHEEDRLALLSLIDLYKDMAEQRQQEIMEMQMMQAQMAAGGGQGGGGGGEE